VYIFVSAHPTKRPVALVATFTSHAPVVVASQHMIIDVYGAV